MNQINKNCQSCGMPLKQDPKGGGTNTDGTISTTYCSYCFEKGTFRQSNWTVQRMQTFVKEKMKERVTNNNKEYLKNVFTFLDLPEYFFRNLPFSEGRFHDLSWAHEMRIRFALLYSLV